MKRTLLLGIVCLITLSVMTMAAERNSRITGNYVEVRGQDVYIGACFANSETGLVGREGTMVWNIQGGEFNGVSLKGLSVAAAMLGKSTLGDRHSNPFPIKTVLLLDSRADERQKSALRAFARQAGGKMLGTVVREEIVPISFQQSECAEQDEHSGDHAAHGMSPAACVSVKAGDLLRVQTRNLLHSDQMCANPEVFYTPMAQGMKNETVVFAEQMVWRGQGLDTIWSIPAKRNGYVAHFDVQLPQQTVENQ